MESSKQNLWAFVVIALIVIGCTGKEKDAAPTDLRAATSDVIRNSNPILEPTRPEGGLVKGRVAAVSAEENADRVGRNKKLPIVWGESVAGITMTTPYLQSLGILSESLGTFQGYYFYNENVRVRWDIQGKRTPLSIVVDVGYQGALSLPQEFGQMHLGDSFNSRFPTGDATGKNFIMALFRAIEKLDSGFDCLELNVCKILIDSDFIEFSFRNGGMLFTNDAKKELRFLYFMPKPPAMTNPLTQPIVFGESAGGINMGMTSSEAKAILGTPAFSSDPFDFFDNGNLGIAWDLSSDPKPYNIIVDRGYQGTWTLPAPISQTFRLNMDMSSYFPADTDPNPDPNGIGLLKKLGRIFDGKAGDVDYDCRLVNSCEALIGTTSIEFSFDKGSVVFDKTAEKRLSTLFFKRPPPPRTTPLTDALIFPTEVAGITMNTLKGDATTILGEPRRMSNGLYYYDNDNILIVWKTTDPMTPLFIQVNAGYRGDFALPSPYNNGNVNGTVKMGADMSAHFAVTDGDKTMIKALARYFAPAPGVDPGYDCLSPTATANGRTCAIQEGFSPRREPLIFFIFKNQGFIAFSKDKKELKFVIFDPEQVVTE